MAVTLALGALLLAGCAKRAGKYQPPVSAPLAKAERWNTLLAGGATAKPVDDKTISQWWASLNDPLLTSLVERAIKGNLELRQAEARVRQTRAQRNVVRTEHLPTVTGGASATGSRANSDNSPAAVRQSYSTRIDASWEPDFFARIRNSIRAYEADLDTAQEDLRDVLVSLTAEVALDYVDARSYQAQLATTKANLAAQEETLRLTMARYESGLATELDVAQARLTVESTRAGIPSLETNLQKSINGIAVLLGERPGAIDAEMAEIKPVPVTPAEVAVGVPADLLRRRPDIRAAERQVAAQTARVGVAQADLYPAFSLSGSISLTALSVADLFSTGALASSAMGSLQHTIFDRRKIREQIKIQDAVLDQNIAAYESTVLSAMKDVEDGLLAFANEQVRRKSLVQATTAAERAATLSRDLYASGLKDFLDVLDAERSLLSLQNQLAQGDATVTADLIRLYKALGGGWNPATAGTAPAGAAGPGTNAAGETATP